MDFITEHCGHLHGWIRIIREQFSGAMWASLIKKTTPIGDGKHFFATTHDLLHMRSSAVSRHCTVLNIQLIPSPQVEDIFFQQLTFSEVIHSTMRFRITRLWPSTLGCGSEHAGSTARPD